MRDSGQTAKFWTLGVRKVVGVPRFELGTPCTPCRSSIRRKPLTRVDNSTSHASRIAQRYEQLSLCFDAIQLPDSGRSLEPGDTVTYRHCEGDRPAKYLGRHGSRHLMTIAVHGAYGEGLRYVEEADFTTTSTAPHGER